MSEPPAFGQIVRKLREKRGLTEAELGSLVGYSESWVSRIEKGSRSVRRVQMIDQLAAKLEASRDERVQLLRAAGYEPTAKDMRDAAEEAIERVLPRWPLLTGYTEAAVAPGSA